MNKKYTGKENDIVIENLKRLLEVVEPQKICVRMPYIPGFNTKDEIMEECTSEN